MSDRLSTEQDALLRPEDKAAAKAWLVRVLEDLKADDVEKRLILANYLLSGQRSGDVT